MMSSSKTVCVVLVLLSIVYESVAGPLKALNRKDLRGTATAPVTLRPTCIHCYYCNTANNSACTYINKLDDEVRARIIPVVNCETSIPSPIAVNFFCRKISQTIYHSRGDSEIRVTRGCGWVRSDLDCYRADNMDHKETVCQCFEDHCNSGERVDPSVATGLFLCLSAVLYFYR